MTTHAPPKRPLHVLRCSGVVALSRCAGLWVARVSDSGLSGPAAQTGNAVGRLIQLWHEGTLMEEAWNRLESEAADFPDADMQAVLEMGAAYSLDPRNGPHSDKGDVEPGSCEREVRLVVPADPLDPTGEPFELRGHLDQLRRGSDGVLRVWDLKSGKPSGAEMLQEYAWQLAAYTLAAAATLGEPVLPGGIIRLRAYEGAAAKAAKPPRRKKGEPKREGPWVPDPTAALEPEGVYWHAPWSIEDCQAMIAGVAQEVALIRMGRVSLRPGLHCRYCPLDQGGAFYDCHQRVPNPFTLGSGS